MVMLLLIGTKVKDKSYNDYTNLYYFFQNLEIHVPTEEENNTAFFSLLAWEASPTLPSTTVEHNLFVYQSHGKHFFGNLEHAKYSTYQKSHS